MVCIAKWTLIKINNNEATYQKVDIFDILGPHSPPAPFEVKFCTAKRTYVSVGPTKFDVNWCNESPLRGEKT